MGLVYYDANRTRSRGVGAKARRSTASARLRNVGHILKTIHTRWVALSVADFATPVGPEGMKFLLEQVDREGELFGALY